MQQVGIGNYDALYEASKSRFLWGPRPGRLVAAITNYLSSGTVLDAGCGDGKNSIYLERVGFRVSGFDISQAAINGLRRRFSDADLSHSAYSVADAATVMLRRSI